MPKVHLAIGLDHALPARRTRPSFPQVRKHLIRLGVPVEWQLVVGCRDHLGPTMRNILLQMPCNIIGVERPPVRVVAMLALLGRNVLPCGCRALVPTMAPCLRPAVCKVLVLRRLPCIRAYCE